MAEALRLSVSGITATEARTTNNPLRNYRPVFENIILSSGLIDRSSVPEKLATALEGLMISARSKGVEEPVREILRIYASEIKNDIVLLTIKRLSDLIESSSPNNVSERLEKSALLMREFQNAADTIPALMANMASAMGKNFDKLKPEELHEMISKSIRESEDPCPKKVLRTMRTKIKRGDFDSIRLITDIKTSLNEFPIILGENEAKKDVFRLDNGGDTVYGFPTNDNSLYLNNMQVRRDNMDKLSLSEMQKLGYRSPEIVWIDEIKTKRKSDDEPRHLPDIVVSVLKTKIPVEGGYDKGEDKGDPPPSPKQLGILVSLISSNREQSKTPDWRVHTQSKRTDLSTTKPGKKNNIEQETRAWENVKRSEPVPLQKFVKNEKNAKVPIGTDIKSAAPFTKKTPKKDIAPDSIRSQRSQFKQIRLPANIITVIKRVQKNRWTAYHKEKNSQKKITKKRSSRPTQSRNDIILGMNAKKMVKTGATNKNRLRTNEKKLLSKRTERKVETAVKKLKMQKNVVTFSISRPPIRKKRTEKRENFKVETQPKKEIRVVSQKIIAVTDGRKRMTTKVVLFKFGIQSLLHV